MIIEPATSADLDEIVRLSMQARRYHNKILGNYFNELNTDFEYRFLTKALADENSILLIARADDTVTGFIFAVCSEKSWLAAPKTASIENICVDEPFRRHGIGRQMIDAVRVVCKEKGVQQLSLGVFCANTNAIPFYEACGFTPLSIKMHMML